MATPNGPLRPSLTCYTNVYMQTTGQGESDEKFHCMLTCLSDYCTQPGRRVCLAKERVHHHAPKPLAYPLVVSPVVHFHVL